MADDEKTAAAGNSAGTTTFSPPGFDMLQNMWRMLSVAPAAGGLGGFGASLFPGVASAGSGSSPSSASGMGLPPLASSEELDRRIAELQTVEQWLKLNLGMLQSTIQALEVQRATLATLKAFGSLAQASFASASANLAQAATAGVKGEAPGASGRAQAGGKEPAQESVPGQASGSGPAADVASGAGGIASEAAAAWWRTINDQFSQLAAFATPPSAPAATPAQASDAAAGAAPRRPAAGAPAAPSKPTVRGKGGGAKRGG